MIKLAAWLIGAFLVCLGILGIVSPETFFETVSFFQRPPAIYLAAVVRIAIGVVLILAARESRLPNIMRVLGILILIGGLLTPFFGVQLASAMLDWGTEGGPSLLRLWAGISIALGVFIIYATAPNRRAS